MDKFGCLLISILISSLYAGECEYRTTAELDTAIQMQTILLGSSFWGKPTAFRNGSEIKFGSWGNDLKSSMQGSPEAVAEMDSYGTGMKRFYGQYVGGLALALVGGAILSNNDAPQWSFPVVIIGGLGVGILSIGHNSAANNHLFRAVWAYNRHVLLKEKTQPAN